MSEKTKEQADREHAERGVPSPQPHEEEAKGTPNDDRLQSEVPQGGESSK